VAELWGLLADEDRLRVFAAIALGARSVLDIADHAGMDPRTVVKALQRLETGGVISGDGTVWDLRRDVIAAEARRTSKAVEAYEEEGLPPRQAAVLRAFLVDGRLASIPSTRSKRLVVLDHVARVFEIGVRYPEREVNALLRAFHADYAALRRHLVDEGFLTREAGTYWRSGGTVEL
jgi:DNA-binding transcriptional ArsR family regulator